ncbi:hypothetical protein AMECASPLE_013742 [Ameca splendens]|uniref:Secreted protein n=1 Tax=Ameca splendens TaxID=208324 RepID=A0ABV0XEI5_9TELE
MQPILIINVYLLSFSSADKQLYIWTGWDISAEQRGNRGPTARCANEQSTEKDSAQQAPIKVGFGFFFGLRSHQVVM